MDKKDPEVVQNRATVVRTFVTFLFWKQHHHPKMEFQKMDRGSAAVAGDLGVGGLAMGRFGVASGVAL